MNILLFNYWQEFLVSGLLDKIVMILSPIFVVFGCIFIIRWVFGISEIHRQNDKIIEELKKLNMKG